MARSPRARNAASDADVFDVERRFGLKFPPALKELFQKANGARPFPQKFRNPRRDYIVETVLTLFNGENSAVRVYEDLVKDPELSLIKGRERIPEHFFPFAEVLGGDYLFVDCSAAEAPVFVFVHDTAFEQVRSLDVHLGEFWSRLET